MRQPLTGWIARWALFQDGCAMHSPTTERARYLRNNMTETECRVWSRLRNRQVGGYKFRRQVPVGPYFVDFLCISARLAIEVDGPLHEDDADQRKTEWLQKAGYRVVRVPAVDVDESFDDVIHGIYLDLTEPRLPTVWGGHPREARVGWGDPNYFSSSKRMELASLGLACGARLRTSATRACIACFLPAR